MGPLLEQNLSYVRPLYSLVGAAALPMSSPFGLGSWLRAVPEPSHHIIRHQDRVQTTGSGWLFEYRKFISFIDGTYLKQISFGYDEPERIRAEVPGRSTLAS